MRKREYSGPPGVVFKVKCDDHYHRLYLDLIFHDVYMMNHTPEDAARYIAFEELGGLPPPCYQVGQYLIDMAKSSCRVHLIKRHGEPEGWEPIRLKLARQIKRLVGVMPRRSTYITIEMWQNRPAKYGFKTTRATTYIEVSWAWLVAKGLLKPVGMDDITTLRHRRVAELRYRT